MYLGLLFYFELLSKIFLSLGNDICCTVVNVV